MKAILFILLTVFHTISFGQSKKQKSITQDSIISKWNNAIVGIETRIDGVERQSTRIFMGNVDKSFSKNELSEVEMKKLLDSAFKSYVSFMGTAIFLEHEQKFYLITARHVLFNKVVSDDRYNWGIDKIRDTNLTYLKIMRTPLVDELPDTSYKEMPIFMLSNVRNQYVFSNEKIDLAIVSIDKYPDFALGLLKRGYKPIKLSDIDTSSINYGQDIMAFGYPGISFHNLKQLDDYERPWISGLVFAKTVTFGKVSIPSYHTEYFMGDITVAPGNSGGAIVSNNKLIGITSKQPYYNLEDKNGIVSGYIYRMPYAFCIKAYLIPYFLKILISQKERGR